MMMFLAGFFSGIAAAWAIAIVCSIREGDAIDRRIAEIMEGRTTPGRVGR
jgi:hypothetical protein